MGGLVGVHPLAVVEQCGPERVGPVAAALRTDPLRNFLGDPSMPNATAWAKYVGQTFTAGAELVPDGSTPR